MTVPVNRHGVRKSDFPFNGGRISVEVEGDLARQDDWEVMAAWCASMADLAMPRSMTWGDLGLPKPGSMLATDIGLL